MTPEEFKAMWPELEKELVRVTEEVDMELEKSEKLRSALERLCKAAQVFLWEDEPLPEDLIEMRLAYDHALDALK